MPKTWSEVPILLCDQFYVLPVNSTMKGDNVRVAFGHNLSGEAYYHTAISLSRESAIQMRDILDGAIKSSTPAAADSQEGQPSKH